MLCTADMQPASSDGPLRTRYACRPVADRARRLARELTDEAEVNRFIGIADEMEAKAAALEAHVRAER